MSAPICSICLHKKARHTLPGGKCDVCTSPGADLGCKYEWPKKAPVSVGIGKEASFDEETARALATDALTRAGSFTQENFDRLVAQLTGRETPGSTEAG